MYTFNSFSIVFIYKLIYLRHVRETQNLNVFIKNMHKEVDLHSPSPAAVLYFTTMLYEKQRMFHHF